MSNEVASKMSRNGPCNYLLVAVVMAFLPIAAYAQTAITLTASVSDVVTVSAAPNLLPANAAVESAPDRTAVTLTLSGSGPDDSTIRIPLLIRSNSSYVLSARARSNAVSANISVSDARATGRFVAPYAVARINLATTVDGRDGGIRSAPMPVDLASPFSILRGSRISLAGTLDSPDNAVEIIVLVTVRPTADNWQLNLTFSVIAEGRL